MRHTTLLRWSPYILVSTGLFDEVDLDSDALKELPVVELAPSERLQHSRSGEPLLVIPLLGAVEVTRGDVKSCHGSGSLLGLTETLFGFEFSLEVTAVTSSAVLLVNRHRLTEFIGLSPLFANRILEDLLAWSRALCEHIPGPMLLEGCGLDEPVPKTVASVVVIKLVNHEVLQLCHGRNVAEHAMKVLHLAVRRSIRPSDIGFAVTSSEYLVGLGKDTQIAFLVARKLLAKISQVSLIEENFVPLPHLHVVAGITASQPGEKLRSAYTRALESAIQATKDGTKVNLG